MKLRLSSSLFLLALSTQALASPPPAVIIPAPGKFYVGAFGGSGSSNSFNASQFGTAFFVEAAGGPLAVNAFGQLNKQNAPFFGGQVGYQAQEIFLNPSWMLAPAAELEGFSMNRRTFNGDLINNTARLPEHDFNVSFPMKRTVFLANAVLGFNHARFPVQPYVGVGIGNAIIRITDASAAQISPPELGINHYNTDTSDTNSTFAGQIKLGLSYDIIKCVSVFAEYRRLYLTSAPFVFGSTVYPTHVETSNWQVKLNDQRYNLGSIGLRLNW